MAVDKRKRYKEILEEKKQALALKQSKTEWMPKEEEIDFDTSAKIENVVGKELMDMDGFATSLMAHMPRVSSEMLYRMQLDMNTRIYIVLMVIGFLMVASVLLYSV